MPLVLDLLAAVEVPATFLCNRDWPPPPEIVRRLVRRRT